MAERYTRRINLYINGKKVRNDITSIRKEMNRLQNEQARMVIGSRQYVAHTAKIRSLKTILQDHNNSLRKTKQNLFSIKTLAEKANHYFGLLTATVGAFIAVIAGFRKASDAAMSFEERLDNLSALTGLEGRQLEWLANQAKEMSVATVEGNIRIKQSADDIVDAYTKVGSQRPELLRNKEALQAVTQDAIILSEAAKDKLEPSVKALTMTLNQHNLAASDSRRVINALAAGSKLGAGDIPYLTEAVEKSGTTLSLMNVSVEEHIGLIESIAPNYSRARVAGNSLDKVFLKMKANQIGYTDGVFNLQDALAELQVRFANGESSAEIFGIEHAKMGELLVQKAADVKYFSNAVTGTEIALEQAAKNTGNRAQQLAQAMNRLQLTLIEFGNKINPIFLKSTNMVNYLIKALMAAPRIIRENQILLIALTGALLAYNHALVTSIALNIKDVVIRGQKLVVDKALSIAGAAAVLRLKAEILLSKKNTAAQVAHINTLKQRIKYEKLFNNTVAANPMAIAILAITAAIVAIKTYDKYNKRALENEEKRIAAIKELTAVNEFYKKDLTGFTDKMGKLNRLSNARKEALQDEIEFNIKLAEAELELQKARQLQIAESNTYVTVWQTLTNFLKAGSSAAHQAAFQAMTAAENGVEAASSLDEQINKLMETIAGMKRQKMDLSDILLAESDADKIGTESLANLEEKLNLYTTALRHAEIGSRDYIRIQEKVKETEEALAEARKKHNEETDPEKQYQKIKESLENTYQTEQNLLKENLLNQKMTKAEFHAEMYSLELAYLESMLLLNQRFGKETASVQSQILDKQLAKKQEIDKMLALSDEISMDLKKQDQKQYQDVLKEMDKEYKKYSQERDNETQKEITRVDKKIKAQEKMRDYYIESSVYAGEAAIDQAETMEDAGAAIMNSIRDQIKAYLAEAIAMQLVAALKSVPFPFNIAVATAAGGAMSLMFNKLIPEFAAGGFTGNNARLFIAGEKGNEWIAPNWMLNDSFTAPIIESLDSIRKSGAMLNPVVPQLALGGYSNIDSNPEDQNSVFKAGYDPEIKKLLQRNIEMQERMLQWNPAIDMQTFKRESDQYQNIINKSGF